VVESGAEGVGVGVVECLEDGECLPPVLACLGGIAGGEVDVAEPGQGGGFAEMVPDVAVQVEGLPKVLGRLGVVAKAMVGVLGPGLDAQLVSEAGTKAGEQP
jgi:hypothetical protein